MQTCQKLSKDTRAPILQSREDLDHWNEFYRKHDPETKPANWLSNVWDGATWRDWYTGEENEILFGGVSGLYNKTLNTNIHTLTILQIFRKDKIVESLGHFGTIIGLTGDVTVLLVIIFGVHV